MAQTPQVELQETQIQAAGWKAAASLLSELWGYHGFPTGPLLLTHSHNIQQRMWALVNCDTDLERVRSSAENYQQLSCQLMAQLVSFGMDPDELAASVHEMRGACRCLAGASTATDLGLPAQ
jgi:hypothetical protein